MFSPSMQVWRVPVLLQMRVDACVLMCACACACVCSSLHVFNTLAVALSADLARILCTHVALPRALGAQQLNVWVFDYAGFDFKSAPALLAMYQ